MTAKPDPDALLLQASWASLRAASVSQSLPNLYPNPYICLSCHPPRFAHSNATANLARSLISIQNQSEMGDYGPSGALPRAQPPSNPPLASTSDDEISVLVTGFGVRTPSPSPQTRSGPETILSKAEN